MNNKNDYKKIITLIIIVFGAYLLISNFKYLLKFLDKLGSAILPFVIGIILAFILNIIMSKIERRLNILFHNKDNKPYTRVIAITISLLLFLIVIVFVSLELIPELVNNIESLINNIPGVIKNIESYLIGILDNYPEVQSKLVEIFNDNTNINSLLLNILNYIVNGSINFVTSFVNSIITIFTSIIFAIYMLCQKEDILSGIKRIISAYFSKKKADKIISIAKLSNSTFTKFVSGQCLEALILGLIFFAILSIFNFPYALLISVLTSITALIPIFGALIAMVIGAILIATISPLKALIFVIIFLVIQQIENNLIYPKVVGKSVGLSPIWTLLAVTVGGSLFGVIGMIVGLPLASILYALLKKDLSTRLDK